MSIVEFLEANNCCPSLFYHGPNDWATGIELREIIEHPDIFDTLFQDHPLTTMSSTDDVLLYMLAEKCVSLREMIPYIQDEVAKRKIQTLSVAAEQSLSAISKGDLIRQLNTSVPDLFGDDLCLHQADDVALQWLLKYRTGIEKKTFEWIIVNHGHRMWYRFSQFEPVFIQYPSFISMLFPTGAYEEIDAYGFDDTLDVFAHILQKQSILKPYVEPLLAVLHADMIKMADNLSEHNYIRLSFAVRKYYAFLQATLNPLANEYSLIERKVSEFVNEQVVKHGSVYSHEIPVGEMLEQWKKHENWQIRLLSTTHKPSNTDGPIDLVSTLDFAPEKPDPLFDIVRSNIRSDDYFTHSHQQKLGILSSVLTGLMLGIMRSSEDWTDLLHCIRSANTIIFEDLVTTEDHLDEDIDFLINTLQLLAINHDAGTEISQSLCFGAAVLLCTLSEKLLRNLFRHLTFNDLYVHSENITMGNLLNPKSTSALIPVFGKNHLHNLMYFFHKNDHGIGRNYRNNLAHWSKLSANQMTIQFVCQILWLYIDILNTVFWFFIKDDVVDPDSSEQ